MTLQSDERLALAYWCLAHGSTRPIRVLPTADQIAIITYIAEIRAEHRRTAIRLAGGRARLDDQLARAGHEAR